MSRKPLACCVKISISLFALVAAGCTNIEDHIPQDGPTMLQIYESHIAETQPENLQRVKGAPGGAPPAEGAPAEGAPAPEGSSDIREASLTANAVYNDQAYLELVTYTREPRNEIDNLFPKLPNPELTLYVFPHLAGEEQLPVPGYATSFAMYERTQYALPGEREGAAPTAQNIFPRVPARQQPILTHATLRSGN